MEFKFKRAKKDADHSVGFIDFENLIGTRSDLYYHNRVNEFQLGRMIFEVLEDENDGYRSTMDHVEIKTTSAPLGQKLATVEIKKHETRDQFFYHLVDIVDGHIWVEFGTDNVDDYYPCFIFRTFVKVK